VAAAGNSNSIRNYQYLDLNGGTALYRIRQVDLDGRATYTAIRQTNCTAGQFDVVLYPVPTRDNLTVVIKSGKSVRTELQIMDMSGRTIRRIPAQINSGNNTINLDVSRIPAGQYMLVSSAPEIEISKKFTVIR
jgi:TATA-box binding protein (TBP) (component of TFIID and TFIIIB)